MNTQDERGSVLMLVVIFSLIMCLLGFAVIYMNGNEYLAARRDLLDARAAYLADAGLAMGVGFLYYCDGRLEDSTDMEIAENEFNAALFSKTTRGKVVLAMGSDPKHKHVHGRNIGDGTYWLTAPGLKKIDNAYPPAWCDIWISSAVNNLMSTDGHYYYSISSRGLSSYGAGGVVDSVKDEELMIEMSSTTTQAKEGAFPPADPKALLYYRGNRYNFNYRVISGKRFTERSVAHIVHY